MKKSTDIIFKCDKCGYEPKGKEQGNWTVYKNEPCPKCGGKIGISLTGGTT